MNQYVNLTRLFHEIVQQKSNYLVQAVSMADGIRLVLAYCLSYRAKIPLFVHFKMPVIPIMSKFRT